MARGENTHLKITFREFVASYDMDVVVALGGITSPNDSFQSKRKEGEKSSEAANILVSSNNQ